MSVELLDAFDCASNGCVESLEMLIWHLADGGESAPKPDLALKIMRTIQNNLRSPRTYQDKVIYSRILWLIFLVEVWNLGTAEYSESARNFVIYSFQNLELVDIDWEVIQYLSNYYLQFESQEEVEACEKND